jgi:manganese transport protein
MELRRLFQLPKTATAPFCPSEVQGIVEVPEGASFLKKLLIFVGPGLLVSVGYMDPGNWATDIEAGSKYGHALLFVVLLSSLSAIVLQCLSMKLGLVSGRDLAQLCRDKINRKTSLILWILAELAIVATDVAEVLGGALAFHLLLGCSLTVGIAITALDTLIVLGLKGKGFRQVEAIILGLIATIGICYFIELWLIKPDWSAVIRGFIPSPDKLQGMEPLYLAIGILGATVMPHNLYLHSSVVQTRRIGYDDQSKRQAIRYATLDTVVSLSLAFLVNAAILILAASAFHREGLQDVTGIDTAYRLLEPVVAGMASVLFAIALLAAGQSSTLTGTIAGQVIMDGFLKLKIPCWKRRVITRGLALIPAFLGVWVLGENSTGRLLVFTQVVLSLQLPFAIYPLIRFSSDQAVMGTFKISTPTQLVAWSIFLLISGANCVLIYQLVTG